LPASTVDGVVGRTTEDDGRRPPSTRPPPLRPVRDRHICCRNRHGPTGELEETANAPSLNISARSAPNNVGRRGAAPGSKRWFASVVWRWDVDLSVAPSSRMTGFVPSPVNRSEVGRASASELICVMSSCDVAERDVEGAHRRTAGKMLLLVVGHTTCLPF